MISGQIELTDSYSAGNGIKFAVLGGAVANQMTLTLLVFVSDSEDNNLIAFYFCAPLIGGLTALESTTTYNVVHKSDSQSLSTSTNGLPFN